MAGTPILFVKGLKVLIGTPVVLQLPARVIRAQITNFRFDTDKAFLLPSSLHGIRRIVHFYKDHPGMDMVIVGHCDLRGDAGYNVRLSRDRAKSIKAYLSDDFETWLNFYKVSIDSVAWGTREDQHMLSHLVDPTTTVPFYAGPINGVNDAATQKAVADFQSSNALDKTGIGPNTRREMIKKYMAEDGTTLPGNVSVHTHGCGFNHPVKPLPGDIPENRRVQIFLFDGPPSPPVPSPDKCPPCTEQPAWEGAATLRIDLLADQGDLGVLVKTSDGALAPGIPVRITGPQSASDTSDADGKADFHNLAPGAYRVVAVGDGVSAERSIVIEAGRATDATLILEEMLVVEDGDGNEHDAVVFGLWDDAFISSAGNVRRQAAGGLPDFVAADSRAFRFSIRDPDAAGATVDVLWATLDGAGAPLDAPSATGAQPPAAITCEDDGSGKHVFKSPLVMLVSDAEDLAEPVHHGLQVAPTGPALRTTGLYNRRIRRASMVGSSRVRYEPAGGGKTVESILPLFPRGDGDPRRRFPVQVFVMRQADGTPMVAVTPGAPIFTVDFRIAFEIYERIGVKFETVTGPTPPGGQLVVDPGTKHRLIVANHPFAVADDKLQLTVPEENALGKAFPMVAPKTVRVFLTFNPADGKLGSARFDHNMNLGLFDPIVEGCCFIQADPRKPHTFAHEIGHVVTDGGHYGQPPTPPNRRFNPQNLMHTPTPQTVTVASTKRLWDNPGATEISQVQAIVRKPSPYTRPF